MLKELMDVQGISQADLALRFNVTQSAVSLWISGKRAAPAHVIEALQAASPQAEAIKAAEAAHSAAIEQFQADRARRLAQQLIDPSQIPPDSIYGTFHPDKYIKQGDFTQRFNKDKDYQGYNKWHIQAMADNSLMIFIPQKNEPTKVFRIPHKNPSK